jgi:hypothetical protein
MLYTAAEQRQLMSMKTRDDEHHTADEYAPIGECHAYRRGDAQTLCGRLLNESLYLFPINFEHAATLTKCPVCLHEARRIQDAEGRVYPF